MGIEYITKNIVADVVEDVKCDICGESCKIVASPDFEYSQLFADWGYGSKNDGEKWDYTFCEVCSLKIVAFIEALKEAHQTVNEVEIVPQEELEEEISVEENEVTW